MIELLFSLLLAVLPMPGTQFQQLPDGTGKGETEAACFACHSADLLAQQRLTPKQWTAAVEKMMRWGADVPPGKKDVIVAYLARNYGPGNKFVPMKTLPVK
jgi:hypothetical protein